MEDTPKILVMGENLDYYVLRTDNKFLQETRNGLPELMVDEEEFLRKLQIEDSKIPANELTSYGGTIPIDASCKRDNKETLIDGYEKLFQKVEGYAKKHSASYVLVQNLDVGQRGHGTFDLSVMAILLKK